MRLKLFRMIISFYFHSDELKTKKLSPKVRVKESDKKSGKLYEKN